MKELTIEDRVKIYLPENLKNTPLFKILNEKNIADISESNIHQYSVIKGDYETLWGKSTERFNQDKINQIKKIYIKPLCNFIKSKKIKFKAIPLLWGDIRNGTGIDIAFSKTRSTSTNPPLSLLKCLNENRHWKEIYNDPIPFNKKKNSAVWRGATTGSEKKQPLRFNLVKKWHNKSSVLDIGFSLILKSCRNSYPKYKKNNLSKDEMTENKFILSVEGNDKDSGLNWKLASNSLVIMPKPQVTSWLMEEKLIPNSHYLEVKPDFSDLEDLVHWGNDNPHKCEEIIHNANQHMKQFEDKEREDEIQKQVIEKTLSYIK